MLNLPVLVTREIDNAEVILALRSHVKKGSKVQRLARRRQVPIHMIKANTVPEIARTLRRVLGIGKPSFIIDFHDWHSVHNAL